MLATVEQIWMLAAREIRLVARSRGRLLRTVTIPLTGGVICGWMTRTTSLPPIYCLALFMALGGLLMAVDPSTRVSRTLSAISGPNTFTAGWTLAVLTIIIAQTAVLTTSAALIGGFEVSADILAATVGVSLVLSVLARRILAA
jgi:hypothetical protein